MSFQMPVARIGRSDVIELNRFSLPVEDRMAMPAIVGDFEDQAASGFGRDLGGIRVQRVLVVQDPQAAVRRFPVGVQIEEERD